MSGITKWFVIFAPDDSSYSLVSESDVICETSVKVGDEVMFVYGSRKKPLEGVVKAMGGDYDDMQKEMNKINRKSPKRSSSNLSDKQDGSKRQRKAKLKCKESLISSNVCKKKLPTANTDESTQLSSILEKVVSDGNTSDSSAPGKHCGENSDSDLLDSEEDNGYSNISDKNDSDSTDKEELTPEELYQLMKIMKGKKIKDISQLTKLNSSKASLQVTASTSKEKCVQGQSTASHHGSGIRIQSDAEPDKATGTDSKKGKVTTVREKSSPEEEIRKTTDKKTVQDSGKKDISKKTATAWRQAEEDLHGGSEGGLSSADEEFTKTADNKEVQDTGRNKDNGTKSASSTRQDEDDLRSGNRKSGRAQRYQKKKYERAVFHGNYFKVDKDTPGSYQLVPSHQVYVLESNLKEIKDESKTILTVARRLTREGFTEEAIMACTVTGRPSSARAGIPSVIRPPLDQEGVKAIYKYCVARAQRKKKTEPTFSEVKRSIGEILNEARFTARLEAESTAD
ncbi:Putative BEN domain-containing protein B1 [Frankliniella fusca]|uniref:BEN domain-containing protein B1 n=1 Tax=Frankliniella fusca TaxID=407009 RepID=A0AAE1LG58_9NEOP|nr:Putative BEN domain-containing protein B1 [Frankliniella fusca]